MSKKTSSDYISYLRERNYDYYVTGDKHVNLKKSFKILYDKHNIKTILTDTGKTLVNVLINKGLADKISLLVHPVIVGKNAENLFRQIDRLKNLKLVKNEVLKKNYLWLVYEVEK